MSLKCIHILFTASFHMHTTRNDNNELVTAIVISSYPRFLAHLSRRLIGELIVYPWSGVRRRPSYVVRRTSSVVVHKLSNIFFSETAWPIKAKLNLEPPWEGGTKFCSRHRAHMTKMAATPIYGKNPSKIFFSRTCRPILTKLNM